LFESYYQSELSFLREMGREFAQAHPAIAGMLAVRGGDPDVERLLEGFAFLAARIRQRVDAAQPELVAQLVELLLPHFLRPAPASTIVQLSPPRGVMRGIQRVDAGSSLGTVEVRGVGCQFRTTRSLDLLPLRLVHQRLDDASPTRPELTLGLEADPSTSSSVFAAGRLRLHLHGELGTATQMLLWFARHVSSVIVRAKDGTSVELGAAAVRVTGTGRDEALWPWPEFSHDGFRVLLEYFTLPSKFLFIEIVGLERAAHLVGDELELVFRFAQPPPLPARMPNDLLRLHCVPAVNLFEASADPVRATIVGRPSLLRVSGVDPLHAEVFDVLSVTGISSARPGRREYPRFSAFSSAMTSTHGGYYTLTRERSPIDEGMHAFLGIGSVQGTRPLIDEETLSIELLCTNRSLPEQLGVGDVCIPTAETPAGVPFRNITPVTRPQRPPLGTELSWRLVAHLAAARRSLADIEALRTMLETYNFQLESDHPVGRANQARIEAIQSVTHKTVTRVVRGAAVRGTRYTLTLDQTAFASEGDAFVFGTVLNHVFATHAPANSFSELELLLKPRNTVLKWTADLR
jgi:type VI secretion system protein ImpG